jgi:hypothetical protein
VDAVAVTLARVHVIFVGLRSRQDPSTARPEEKASGGFGRDDRRSLCWRRELVVVDWVFFDLNPHPLNAEGAAPKCGGAGCGLRRADMGRSNAAPVHD